MSNDIGHELQAAEEQLLRQLRTLRHKIHGGGSDQDGGDKLTIGQKVADGVAATMGSWAFIITQTAVLAIWIVLNVTAYVQRWDPYPFILLNLALSFQAAYAAPFIMMAQNRQQDIDRKEAENDHKVNIKAELEIELLHQKIDELREKEVVALTQAVADLSQHVRNEAARAPKAPALQASAPKARAPKAPAKARARTAKPKS